MAATMSAVFLFYFILIWNKPFDTKLQFIAQTGSVALTLVFLCIADYLSPKAMNYFYISIIGVRVAVTFVLMYLIKSDTQGFEQIDPKNLHDSIPIIVSPVIVLSFYNWSTDMLVGVPLTIVS